MIKLSILFILLILIFPKSAHAYLDPGSGSYFIQMLIGLVLGGIFSMKIFWKKISTDLKRLFLKSSKDAKKRK